MLWAFNNLLIYFQQVRFFERFETEVIVVEITIVYDCRVQTVGVLHYDVVSLFTDHRCLTALIFCIMQVGYNIYKSEKGNAKNIAVTLVSWKKKFNLFRKGVNS